jgi:hypothetical protein
MIKRGFPNLPIIQRAVRELWRVISPDTLRARFASAYHATRAERPDGDSIIATQQIARRIALLYRLRIGTVVVTFVSSLDRPGRIELSDSDDFFIELHADYRRRYEQVAAILAHEVAHIFCHRLKLSIGDTFQDEVLTDTTATYLGAGVPILNAFTEESAYSPETPNLRKQQCFGYITPDEFGYLLAKRHSLFGEDPAPFLTTTPGTEAYRCGRERAQQDLRPPLRSAPLAARAAYRMKRAFTKTILFDCPTCFQRLRLPTGRGEISVRCPNCHEQFPCFT